TDDDADIKSIASDGLLYIKDKRGSLTRMLEVTPANNGQLQRIYYLNGEKKVFDQEAQQWLARILPQLIRDSAIGASARVARIHKQKGAEGVLAEISLITSDGAKGIYFRELFAVGNLDNTLLQRVLRQIGRDIASDGEKGRLLIEHMSLFLNNEAVTGELFSTIDTIASDGERERILVELIGQVKLSKDNLKRAIKSTAKIASDGSKERVLIRTIGQNSNDDVIVGHILQTVESIASDGSKERVLVSLLQQSNLSRDSLVNTIRTAQEIASDGSKERVLIKATEVATADETVAAAVLDVAKTIASDSSRGRVLSALLQKGMLPHKRS
ncbi:MAG: hypothetical protein AB1489_34375, partial [Acidobacteriota bacterium]